MYGYAFTWAIMHCQIFLLKGVSKETMEKSRKMKTVEEQKQIREVIEAEMKELIKTNETYKTRIFGLLKEASEKGLF